MKRKITCLLCAALAVISLLTTIAVPASAVSYELVPEEEEEFRLFSISDISTEEDYEEWNNLMLQQANNNFYQHWAMMEGNWVYYLNTAESFASLAKMRKDGTDKSKFDVDRQHFVRLPLFTQSGYLYYLRYNGKQRDLYRCLSSGNNMECIVSNVYPGNIQLVGDSIYYTTAEVTDSDGKILDESCHLYRCELDGSGKTEILKKPVYYFNVFDDKVMYQDDRDGATLHIYNMTTKNDKKITNRATHCPLYTGYTYYYISSDYKTIYSMGFDGEERKVITFPFEIYGLSLCGDHFYFSNEDDESRVYRCKTDGSEMELVIDSPTEWGYGWVGPFLTYVTPDGEVYLCAWDGSNKYELKPVQ